MIGKGILEEECVSMAEVKSILKKRSKEMKEEELNYEQKVALEHLNKFTRLSLTKAKKLVEELVGANEKIKQVHAVKIADHVPEDEGDLRAIFAKERFVLAKGELKQILDIVSKYR